MELRSGVGTISTELPLVSRSTECDCTAVVVWAELAGARHPIDMKMAFVPIRQHRVLLNTSGRSSDHHHGFLKIGLPGES
jgi:hypothetical protein